MLTKENLVVVPGFATNKTVLADLIRFLGRYFSVYFIELPGNAKDTPALPRGDFPSLTNYFQERIDELNLTSYWMCGISFGFYMTSSLREDDRCKGILAVEPFTSSQSMKGSSLRKGIYKILINFFGTGNRPRKVWESKLLLNILRNLQKTPNEIMKIVVAESDPKAIFCYLNLIFNTNTRCPLRNIPHILVMNENDKVVDYQSTVDFFKAIKDLKIINIEMSHFPDEPTFDYFEKNLENAMVEAASWVESRRAM